MEQPRLILASRSERRAMLLRGAGFEFVSAEPVASDPDPPAWDVRGTFDVADRRLRMFDPPAAKVRETAYNRALWLARSGHERIAAGPHTLVLAAETVVVDARGVELGVPTSPDTAERILRELMQAAGYHRVVTGFAIFQPDSGNGGAYSESVQITLEPVDDEVLAAYLASGAWSTHVAGYNVLELGQDDAWPFALTGDPHAIFGFPMQTLHDVLAEWSVRPRRDDWQLRKPEYDE